MRFGDHVRKFYQTNLANGEFAKHKGAYLVAALLGMYVGCRANAEPVALTQGMSGPLPASAISEMYSSGSRPLEYRIEALTSSSPGSRPR